MRTHLLMYLVWSVTLVLLATLVRPELPFSHLLVIMVVLVVLIMVVGGASRYLASVLSALAKLFHGR